MSVYMSFRVKGDAAKLEQLARDNQDTLLSLAENAKQQGCIHHTFAATDDEVVVMDEWESEDAFHRFFEAEGERIRPMMEQVAPGEQPQITFYRPLRLGDEF